MNRLGIFFVFTLMLFACRDDDDNNNAALPSSCEVVLEIRERSFQNLPPNFNEVDSIFWNYDNGKLSSQRVNAYGSSIDYLIEYDYTAFGKLAEIRICGLDTAPCYIMDRLIYDAENRLSRIDQYIQQPTVRATVDFTYQSDDTIYVDFSEILNDYRYIYNSKGNIESTEDSLNSANYSKAIYLYDDGINPYYGNLLDGFYLDHLSKNNWLKAYRTIDSLIGIDSIVNIANPAVERTIEHNALNYPIRIEQRSSRSTIVVRFEYDCQ